MNNVQLTGRLVADANLTFTAGKGTAMAKFKLAVDKGFGDNKKTAFIDCIAWGKGAEALANFTQKGSKILLNGSIETGSYDNKSGAKVYTTTVVADMFGGIEFLDKKGENNVNSNGGSSNNNSFDEDMTPVDEGDMPF